VAGLAQFATPQPVQPVQPVQLLRLRLDFGYDGTEFCGWARQPGLRSVEGELATAVGTVVRVDPPPRLTVAGRTDAGVHARGQVAHLDVPSPDFALPSMVRRLNGILPLDIRVRQVRLAAEGFDARFSALARRYSYRVADGWFDPLRRHDTLTYPRPLDLGAMNEAAAKLLGEHDFSAFCRRRVGATRVRALLALDWARDEAGIAVARVEADAFCHSMVRALVGALLAVGDGRHNRDWPAAVLAGRDRDPRVTVAAARALTLEEVRYPSDAEVALRAQHTRRRRDEPDLAPLDR
jgi:tRNA pseudouridine38-40 synthase